MTGTINHLQMSDDTVLAFEFTGIVTRHNLQPVVDTILPLVRGAGRYSLVLIFRGQSGRESNLKFDATMISRELGALSNLERVAIVGKNVFADRLLAALGPILPLDIQLFDDEDTEDPWMYVGARPILVSNRSNPR